MDRQPSRLFHPYKALGLICTEVPFVVRPMPKQRIATVLCAVGNAIHQYNAQSLRIISISEPLPSKVNVIACDRLYVYVAYGSTVAALHLSRKIKYLYENGHASPIHLLLPFGHNLVSIDKNSKLVVWDIETREIYAEITNDLNTFSISALCHPVTYLNKVLLGSEQGQLRLVNLKTTKLVHEFAGWGSAVETLEQSPANDVIGIGLKDGTIIIHNLKFDEMLMKFKQDWGKVVSLAFRTDGPPTMVSASEIGHLAVWDLEKHQLMGQMTDTHQNSVTGLHILHSQPLMITSSPDNSMKTWIFDLPGGLGRELASRNGHSLPATCVRFYGEDGEMVYSASQDGNVRSFSTWKDTKQNNIGSSGKMSRQIAKKKQVEWEEVKLPPVLAMAAESSRESAWDNIVCCHEDSPVVTTWTSRRRRLGDKQLIHPRFESQLEFADAIAKCCSVTACGNFALIGYSTGHVDLWNIQSGLHRGCYAESKGKAHDTSVTGVTSNALNTLVVTAGSDCLLKLWRFKSKKLIKSLPLDSSVTAIHLHRDNNLLAVATDNGNVLVVDIECCRIVRRFTKAHSDAIMDLTFNPSGDWLVSSGRDGLVNVWELKSAIRIDAIRFKHACTSLSFSPTAEYLATCHENQNGVYLWANKVIYEPTMTLKPLSDDFQIPVCDLPESQVNQLESEQGLQELEEDETMETDQSESAIASRGQISNLVTLSGLPTPRWALLIDMDTIRARNKPIEPPKKPKSAPFFLPTVSDLGGFTFDIRAEADQQNSKIVDKKRSFLEPQTEFGKLLMAEDTTENRSIAFENLKQLGPAKIDSEIRILVQLGQDRNLPIRFLKMIKEVVESKKDFELAHSYLSVFLKIHRTELWAAKDEELEKILDELSIVLTDSWHSVDIAMVQTLGVIQWLKSALL